MARLIVTGTDTGIGKTVFAAGLAAMLGAGYWKPIQAGLEGESDSAAARRLGVGHVHPEAYRLATPCSPHRAAELDGVRIDVHRLAPPPGPLVIEGAGGLLVPVTRALLFADLFARWALPIVIVARTSLGTINHSLLTIEAARARDLRILGVAFVGAGNDDSEATICAIGGVKRLGRLPLLDRLDAEGLAAAMRAGFDGQDFP